MTVSDDIASFNRLFMENRQRFIRFAATYLHDEVVAEDIFMEAIMGYWEKRNSFGEDDNIPAYILTSIKNKALNYLRHQQTVNEGISLGDYDEWELSTRITTLEACIPGDLFAKEIQQIINEVLSHQSPTTARIFVLSRYENKSHKEISELMEMTVKGVEFHIAKVTKQLRIALKDYLIFFPFLYRLFQ